MPNIDPLLVAALFFIGSVWAAIGVFIYLAKKSYLPKSKVAMKTSNTVKDLRALSNCLAGSDDRELVQHAADMIEVLSKSSAPSSDGGRYDPAQGPFDEHALGREIARIWGEHGAHSEVYRMLLQESARYRWLRAKGERDRKTAIVEVFKEDMMDHHIDKALVGL